MNNNTFYFSHDYSTRSDLKIKKLIQKHGMLGYGIYWAIVEDLYINANALRLDYECIAFDLRVEETIIKSIINDFDLFVINDEYFYSESIKNRLEARNQKSEKARLNAKKRWNDANDMQTHSEGNAIKERKGKEKKGKEIIVSKDTDKKNRMHSFEQSEIFDKKKFAESFPDWSKEKLAHYYESALLYSQSKGKKYLNWKSAILNWDRTNPYNSNKKQSYETRKSELTESIAQREQRIINELSS